MLRLQVTRDIVGFEEALNKQRPVQMHHHQVPRQAGKEAQREPAPERRGQQPFRLPGQQQVRNRLHPDQHKGDRAFGQCGQTRHYPGQDHPSAPPRLCPGEQTQQGQCQRQGQRHIRHRRPGQQEELHACRQHEARPESCTWGLWKCPPCQRDGRRD